VYDKTVRRRRAVLGLLVALSLILLSAYFGESAGGGLHAIQRGFVTVVSPIEDGASRALKPVRDLVGWVRDTLNAKSQRDRLQKEVQQLEIQNAQNAAGARQAGELAAIMGLNQRLGLTGYHKVTARVISLDPTLWWQNVTVNAGSSSGVRRNDAVVSGAGLIGKVTEVTADSAIVTLITDNTSGVSARDDQNGALGIVQPAVGNPNSLLLQYVSNPEQVQPNDLVVTSGTSSGQLPSEFPANIPIGRVTSVNPGDLYEDIHIAPLANLRSLDLVQIFTRSGPLPGSGSTAVAAVPGG
jgi:rod shape-determining protein MreC